MVPSPRETSTRPVLGLTADYYRSPTIFAAARDKLFRRTWQYACHVSQVADVGSYFAFSIFDQQLLLVRDQDRQLRCFFNVCRHRGHVLMEGAGRTREIVCPYHAWAYTLDGRLHRAPRTEELPGFSELEICLTEVRLESLCGFLFVNLDISATPLQEQFPGLEAELHSLCPSIERQRFAEEHNAREDCNWLVAIENHNEAYHCRTAHRTFAAGVIDAESYDIQPFASGSGLRHFAKAQRGGTAWYDTSGSDFAAFFLWPAFSLQIYPSGLVNSYHWRPLTEETTQVHRCWFSEDGKVAGDLRKVIDLDRATVFAEDLVLVRRVQQGLRSQAYRPGPLVVNTSSGVGSEESIALLHDWLREAFRDQTA